MKKILICNIAHIGDVALSAAMLGRLKKQFPQSCIGFLTSSYGYDLVRNHPLVDNIHIIDHWQVNRKKMSFLTKWRRYRKTRKKALREIKKMGYDIAINLYSFFPNPHFFLWQTKIKERIGYANNKIGYGKGGFHLFLSKKRFWKKNSHSLIERHEDLLNYALEIPKETDDIYLLQKTYLSPKGYIPRKYVLMHPGAGEKFKLWGEEKWRDLIDKCIKQKIHVVVIGKGPKEISMIQNWKIECSYVHIFYDLLWEEYMFVLKNAHLVVGMHSCAVLLGSLLQRPSLGLYTQTGDPFLWKPLKNFTLLSSSCEKMPCKGPCQQMSCLRNIDCDQVFYQITKHYENSSYS